eukprot:524096_1
MQIVGLLCHLCAHCHSVTTSDKTRKLMSSNLSHYGSVNDCIEYIKSLQKQTTQYYLFHNLSETEIPIQIIIMHSQSCFLDRQSHLRLYSYTMEWEWEWWSLYYPCTSLFLLSYLRKGY